MTAYTFRPRAWAVLLTLLLAAGMVTAGFWQYGRGAQKQALQALRLSAVSAPAQDLMTDSRLPPRGQSRRVSLQGQYLPDTAVLLDNQPSKGRPGMHAWIAVQLADGRRVIVDRGWLPISASAAAPPAGPQAIEGQWKAVPQPAMRLGPAITSCQTPRPQRVTYPDDAARRCLFGADTLNGLLELDAAMPGGFERDWAASGVNEIPPSRHYGYAAQWWLFAVTLLVLFIKIHLKKKPAAHD